MQRRTIRIRAIAANEPQKNVFLKLAFLALVAIAVVVSHNASAGVITTRAAITDRPEVTQLGSEGAAERAFLEGVAAYQDGQYDRAVRLWHAPAEQGHVGAQFNLGVAFATGQGADVNYAQAARWWQSAGHQGHTTAQYNLGLLYSRGQGVDKSAAKARMWWYLAAMSGDAAAQFHLGAMAATGDGEAQDFNEAALWWTRSAAQGYEPAVKGLEILKEHGILNEATVSR